MDTETLRALAARNQADKETERVSYADLVKAIWAAADGGMTQVEIVRAVGLTRERVRQICSADYRARMRDR